MIKLVVHPIWLSLCIARSIVLGYSSVSDSCTTPLMELNKARGVQFEPRPIPGNDGERKKLADAGYRLLQDAMDDLRVRHLGRTRHTAYMALGLDERTVPNQHGGVDVHGAGKFALELSGLYGKLIVTWPTWPYIGMCRREENSGERFKKSFDKLVGDFIAGISDQNEPVIFFDLTGLTADYKSETDFTLFELAHILEHPQYLKRSLFYLNYNPISTEKAQEIARILLRR